MFGDSTSLRSREWRVTLPPLQRQESASVQNARALFGIRLPGGGEELPPDPQTAR